MKQLTLEEIIKRIIEKTDFSKHIMGSEPLQDDEFTDMEDVMLGFRNSRLSLSFIIQFNNDIRIEYAKECSQASLEKASEKGLVEHRINGNSQKSQVIGNRHETFSIDKESIITPDNIVIL